MQVYKIALSWNKTLFKVRKAQFIKTRRELVKSENNDEEYLKVCMEQNKQDELCLQQIIEQILLRLRLTDQKFQDSMLEHFKQPEKMVQIR